MLMIKNFASTIDLYSVTCENYPFERFGTTMTNTSITAGSMAATRTHTTIQPLQPPPTMQLLLPQQTIQILHLFKDLHPAVVVAMLSQQRQLHHLILAQGSSWINKSIM